MLAVVALLRLPVALMAAVMQELRQPVLRQMAVVVVVHPM
jgi:hypothetical protein